MFCLIGRSEFEGVDWVDCVWMIKLFGLMN